MSRWLQHQLEPVRATASGVCLVLDPARITDPQLLPGEVVELADWWGLRSAYERLGRRRPPDRPPLVLLLQGPLATAPFPWDIEQAAAAVVHLRLPGPPIVRAVLAQLDGDEAERAIAAVAVASTDPEDALLAAIAGVHTVGPRTPRSDQLRVAARLAARPRRPEVLLALARTIVIDPVPAALLRDPPDSTRLQAVWNAHAAGRDPAWAADLEAAKPEIALLFAVGLLEPVAAASAPGGWDGIGIRHLRDEERVEELLDRAPISPPTDAGGWHAVAVWWGDVRRLVAGAPAELRERAWVTWANLDAAFLTWLRQNYGALLTSGAAWPSAVHRIPAFLARRLRDGHAERVMLVVLDGLGHAQWAHLRERVGIEVVEGGSVLALVPTYTTVSRQAIFAGALPATFPGTLWTTQPEKRRWQEHWATEGGAVTEAAYHRVKGRLPNDRLGLGDAPVIGVVVNAVDDLMHTSELLGDAQLLANLDAWAANGFLEDLVTRATAAGIETWLTADHGNLECVASGAISEGVAVESAGKRLLRYPNLTLRDASAAQGIVWDNIPGLPAGAEPLMFASGRSAFTNNLISVSHGGLSFDEVIVPLARVRA